MSNTLPQYRIYPVNLVPGAQERISVTGNNIVCLTASERFDLSLNGASPVPFQQGLALPNIVETVTEIVLIARAGAVLNPNFIELAVGFGDIRDFRFNVTAPLQIDAAAVIQTKVPAELVSPAVDAALLADTNTLIANANVKTDTIEVFNLSTTQDVRLATDTANLSATRGLIVPPRTARSFRMNGNLYARAIGGAATVSVAQTLYP